MHQCDRWIICRDCLDGVPPPVVRHKRIGFVVRDRLMWYGKTYLVLENRRPRRWLPHTGYSLVHLPRERTEIVDALPVEGST